MGFPTTFGLLTSPAALSDLDNCFAYLAQFVATPCTASSGNAKILTPIAAPSPPAFTALNEGQLFTFISPDTTTGNVSIVVSGVAGGPYFVYNADATITSPAQPLLATGLYIARYSSLLTGGAGGFQVIGPPPNLDTGFPVGVLKSANMNSTADQAIPISLPPVAFTKYCVIRILATNPSVSMTTAAGGIYGAASKGAPIIVAAAQAYSGLTTNTIDTVGSALFLTIANPAAMLDKTTLYLSLTTPQGAAATADFYVYINPLT